MSRGSFTPETGSENGKEKSRKPDNTAFKQQRLPAWQPILTAQSVLPAFFLTALIFIPIGVALLLASQSVLEYSVDYTIHDGCGQCATVRENVSRMMESCKCNVTIAVEKNMSSEVYLYYGLSNFFQNHRRYVKSRDDNQLVGNDVSGGVSSDCAPYNVRQNSSADNKPIAPCGAIANSLFNDTFVLSLNGVAISVLKTGIAWETDHDQKFNNPPPPDDLTKAFSSFAQPFFWQKRVEELDPDNISNNGFENEAFIVWMRTAAFPTFRKLYGRIPRGLTSGNYSFEIDYNYPVTSFDGKKRIILSTTSWVGGKNDFLGIAYLVVGSLCCVVGLSLCIVHHVTKKSLGAPGS